MMKVADLLIHWLKYINHYMLNSYIYINFKHTRL